MASVYYGGDELASSLLYTPMSEGMSSYISSLNSRTLERIGEIGRGFMQRAVDIYKRSGFEDLVSLREHANRLRKQAIKDIDTIAPCTNLTDFVTATPRMRRWVIANPNLRKRYRQKQISGWDNEVVDDIQWKPEEHPDYLYVTNGMLIDDKIVEYIDFAVEQIEDVEQLHFGERCDILDSWDAAESIIQQGYDPTSKWGALLE